MENNLEWKTDDPAEPGYYVVVTKTRMGGNNAFKCYWDGNSWGFSNQTFVKYLSEKISCKKKGISSEGLAENRKML